jgi:hypothetical protein
LLKEKNSGCVIDCKPEMNNHIATWNATIISTNAMSTGGEIAREKKLISFCVRAEFSLALFTFAALSLNMTINL